jgi:hypothetical protein
MLDLFELLPTFAFWPTWVTSLLALALFWGAQLYLSRWLSNPTATSGIVSLELAGTSKQAENVLESWDNEACYIAILSVRWDFGYIASYALTLSHGCAWASRQVISNWHWEPWLGSLIVALVWIAAVCDVGENIALLRMLRAGVTGYRAAWASRFAVAKFGSILVTLAFLLTGVVGGVLPSR